MNYVVRRVTTEQWELLKGLTGARVHVDDNPILADFVWFGDGNIGRIETETCSGVITITTYPELLKTISREYKFLHNFKQLKGQ